MLVVAWSPLLASVEVAETPSWIEPLKSAGGVNERPASWPAVRLQLPSGLCVPALRLALLGTPVIVTARLSDPSVSVRAAERSSAIELSSMPPTLAA